MIGWRGHRAERSNPYLDWELRNSTTRTGAEDWCSVQIQLLLADDGSYVPNLGRLARIVSDGREEEDVEDALTIRMSGDEFLLLTELVRNIAKGRVAAPTDPLDVQFFVYRPQSVANRSGRAAANGIYEIINVGPPIRTLNFARGRTEPTEFDHTWADLSRRVGIGIIDDGIAFANRRFCDAKGRSRIKAIWLQDVERPTADLGVAFGRRLNNAEIDGLLAHHKTEADIYRSVGLIDFGTDERKPLALRASHGTHILDLAGGYDPATEPVENRRPLFAVQLPSSVSGDTSGVTMGSYVLQAARQIMLWADMVSSKLPLVINFSYGIEAGPKDGTQHIERALSQMIDRRNRRGAPTYLVLPAGNSYRERTTARMVLEQDASDCVDWIMLPDDGTPNHLEIWLDGDAIEQRLPSVGISLTPPGRTPTAIVGLGDGDMQALEADGNPIAGIYCNMARIAGQPDRARIHLSVNATTSRWNGGHAAPAGRWKLTIVNGSQVRLTAHLYVQRDDTPMGHVQRGRQSYFDHREAYDRVPLDGSYRQSTNCCPITCEDTLSAIATGAGSLVVGAVDATGQPTEYTASGPTLARNGPDCAAVADQGFAHWGVLATGTYSGSVVAMRGTSVAAPQLVRKLAEHLESLETGPVVLAFDTVDGNAAGTVAAPGAEVLRSIAPEAIVASPHDVRRVGAFILRENGRPRLPPRTYPRSRDLR